MSTYDDNLLAARFAALAPEPLPGDWADVLGRAGARKGRRRARALARSGPSSPAPRRARCRGVRRGGHRLCVRRARLRHRQGHRRAASGGSDAEYSRERSARDVLLGRHDSAQQELGVRRRAADPVWCGGPTERRAAASSSNASHARESSSCDPRSSRQEGSDTPSRRPAASPLDSTAAIIEVRKGDRLVPLRWASDLKRLEARLTDPESWLPASAWKQRKIRAYVPSRFEVCAAAVVVATSTNPIRARSCRCVLLASWLCYRRQPRTCSAAGTGMREGPGLAASQ